MRGRPRNPSVAPGPGAGPFRLPDGFRVVLDRDCRWADGGAVLFGTVPPRLVRLDAAQRRLLGPEGRELVVHDAASAAMARGLLDTGLAHPALDAAGPSPELVTVVVPVRDRDIGRLLAALVGSGAGDLVVVDDGSRDPHAAARAATAANGRVCRHPVARGPAAARNTGFAAAVTPFVVFLDSDVVPEPGWLPPLLAHLADPAVALVAPRVVALRPERDGDRARGLAAVVDAYEARRSSLDQGLDPAPVAAWSRVSYVPSAAILVRRAAVDGPLFDAALHVGEDVDLVRRLDAAGWVLRYEPGSRVAHDHRVRPSAWLRRKAFYGSGAAALARRHPGTTPAVTASSWTVALCALLAVRGAKGVGPAALVGAAAVVRLARRLRVRTRVRAAALLVAFDVVGGAWQLASALNRHYWPLAVAAAVVSRRARRVLAVAAIGEGVADGWAHRRRDPRVRISLPGYVVAHRLDDLAYTAGVWWGMARSRTLAPLRPVVTVEIGVEQRDLPQAERAPHPVVVPGRVNH